MKKQIKRRCLQAHALQGKAFRQKVVRDKTAYVRKPKHAKGGIEK